MSCPAILGIVGRSAYKYLYACNCIGWVKKKTMCNSTSVVETEFQATTPGPHSISAPSHTMLFRCYMHLYYSLIQMHTRHYYHEGSIPIGSNFCGGLQSSAADCEGLESSIDYSEFSTDFESVRAILSPSQLFGVYHSCSESVRASYKPFHCDLWRTHCP